MVSMRILPPNDDRFRSACKSLIQGRIDFLEKPSHDSESAAGLRLHDEGGQPFSEVSLSQRVTNWLSIFL